MSFPNDRVVGNLRLGKGETSESASAHGKVLSQYEQMKPEDETVVDMAVSQGDHFMRLGKFSEAMKSYQTASGLAGDRAELRFKMMVLLAREERYWEAVRELRSGLSLNPRWFESAPSLAELLGSVHESEIQLLIRETAFWSSHDRQNVDRLFLIGAILALNGDSTQATNVLQAIGRISPPDVQVRSVLESLTRRRKHSDLADVR